MSTSPNLALPYIVASQAQKEVTHNDALNGIDALMQGCAISRTLSAPPSSPANGDVYLVAASPSGAWTGYANAIAAYYNGWIFKTPQAGWRLWAKAESRMLYFTGSAWSLLDTPKIDATFSWTPGSVSNAGGVTSSAVTVTGAAFGDFVSVAAPYALQGVAASAYVSAADTVQVRLVNTTGSAVTLASGTWRVRVEKA